MSITGDEPHSDVNCYNLQEMEKLQAKGEVSEDELKALELDMTGKVYQIIFISLWSISNNLIRSCWHPGEEPDSKLCKSFERCVIMCSRNKGYPKLLSSIGRRCSVYPVLSESSAEFFSSGIDNHGTHIPYNGA